MRKKALKKLYPDRGKKIRQNRENFQLRDYTHNNGAVTQLNFIKHFLFNKPYKNMEFQKDFRRFTNEMYNKMKERVKEGEAK